MLKADLHIHCSLDPEDRITATPEKIIDTAAALSYSVLSFTCHNRVIHNEQLAAYALRRNILLIPGVERTIEGKHILIYNITEEESTKLLNLSDLAILKENKNILVIAPHPYYPCIEAAGKLVEQHPMLFDGLEYSSVYHDFVNFNHKTTKIAKKLRKSLVGNTDLHSIDMFGYTYTLIDAEQHISSVLQAIRSGQCQVKSSPMPLGLFTAVAGRMVLKTAWK